MSSRRVPAPNSALHTTILERASELFAENGYEEVSMRQIAKAAGCSATAIYLFFESKDDLLFTVVEDAFEQFVAAMDAAAASSGSPRDRLAAIGMAYIEFAIARPVDFRLMFIDKPKFLLAPSVRDRAPRLNALAALRNTVGEILDLPPTAPPVLVAADALWGGVHGIAVLHVSRLGFTAERAREAGTLQTRLMSTGLGH